jgi:hypothetical protein
MISGSDLLRWVLGKSDGPSRLLGQGFLGVVKRGPNASFAAKTESSNGGF